jgi:hypothetical protein
VQLLQPTLHNATGNPAQRRNSIEDAAAAPLACPVLSHAVRTVWSGGIRRAGPSQRAASTDARAMTMLWTLFVVLLLLWILGVVSSYTLGGFIHILLVLAVVAVLVQLISGRRVV